MTTPRSSNDPTMYITQGSIWRRLVRWFDKDGNPVNLTGREGRLVIRQPSSDPDPILVLTSDPAAGIIMGGVTGEIEIVIGANVALDLPVGKFKFDFKVYYPGQPALDKILIPNGNAIVAVTRQQAYP